MLLSWNIKFVIPMYSCNKNITKEGNKTESYFHGFQCINSRAEYCGFIPSQNFSTYIEAISSGNGKEIWSTNRIYRTSASELTILPYSIICKSGIKN